MWGTPPSSFLPSSSPPPPPQEPGSYVGEVVKVMGKNKVLVKVRDDERVYGGGGGCVREGEGFFCVRGG